LRGLAGSDLRQDLPSDRGGDVRGAAEAAPVGGGNRGCARRVCGRGVFGSAGERASEALADRGPVLGQDGDGAAVRAVRAHRAGASVSCRAGPGAGGLADGLLRLYVRAAAPVAAERTSTDRRARTMNARQRYVFYAQL